MGTQLIRAFTRQRSRASLPLLFGLAYAVFMGATSAASSDLTLKVVSQTLAVGAILVWVASLWRTAPGLTRTPVDLGLALLVLAHLASIPSSVDPRLSFESTMYLVLFVGLFAVFVDKTRHSWTGERVAATLRLLSMLVVAATLLEMVVWRWGIFGELGWGETLRGLSAYRGRLILGHANPLGWFLGMMVPLWLEAARVGRSRRQRISALVWVALIVVAEVSTFSRGGWLVTAAAVTSWVFLTIGRTERGRLWIYAGWRSRRRRIVVLAGLAALVVSITVGAWWGVTHIRPGTVGFRLELWALALQLLQNDPLTGSGAGTFGLAIRSLDPPPPPGSGIATVAHNGYLNVVAETGTLGLLAILLLGLQFVRAMWVNARLRDGGGDTASPRTRDTAVLVPSLIGLLVANLFDTTSDFPYMTLLLVLLTATVLAPRSRVRPLGSPAFVRWISLSVGAILVGSFIWFDLAELYQARAIRAAQAGESGSAALQLDYARAVDPALRVYPLQYGVVRGQEFVASGDDSALKDATDLFEQQVSLGLRLRLVESNLAWLRWHQGDSRGAVAAMRDAVERTPTDAAVWLWLGFLQEDAGELDEARVAYARALARWPNLSRSAYWKVSKFFPETKTLLTLAMEEVPEIPKIPENLIVARQAHLAFRAGDTRTARLLLEEAYPTEEALFVQALLALEAGRADAAENLATQMLSLGGPGGRGYLVRGHSRLAQGHTEQARKDFLAAARLGQPVGRAYLGEMLYEQARYPEAIQAYEAGLRPPCPAPPLIYVFDSNVYHRADYLSDFTPEVLRCAPQDDLLPLYLHLADAYLKVGRQADADDLLTWLRGYELT